MITLKSILEDAKINSKIDEANDTYFKSFTQAVEYARKATEKRGFTIDEDDWQTQIAGLLKNGKPQRKSLQISVFGMDSGSYELTHYIN